MSDSSGGLRRQGAYFLLSFVCQPKANYAIGRFTWHIELSALEAEASLAGSVASCVLVGPSKGVVRHWLVDLIRKAVCADRERTFLCSLCVIHKRATPLAGRP